MVGLKRVLKIGVFMGRFQPFHLGHLSAVRFALRQVDLLYIAVGSAQRSHEVKNPFTSGERLLMIRNALEDASVDSKRIFLVAVLDAPAHSCWLSYVDMVIPQYDLVFSNEPLTIRLFREKGLKVVPVPLQKRRTLSATKVRERILKNGDWESLVPLAVASSINEFGGVQRIRELAR